MCVCVCGCVCVCVCVCVLWVELNSAHIFANSVKELHHACQRLRILLTTTEQVDVPMCLADA